MKIYIDDELPKNCKECHFMVDRGELKSSRLCYEKNFVNCDCKLNPNIGYIGITKPHGCPLETTQSLKQQVRKEVVEEIRERLKKANFEIMAPIDLYSYTDNFLYQVEKGETK